LFLLGSQEPEPKGLKTRVGNVKDWAGGIDGLKNQSGKCEGPAGGDGRVKELKWEM
jgi:hypothetical protein